MPAACPTYPHHPTSAELWPLWWRSESVWWHPQPDRAVAAFTGMALFWDREAQLWREPHWCNDRGSPMPAEEAEEAAAYVRRTWLRKRKGVWAPRMNRTNLALNVAREATPQQAVWVATFLHSNALQWQGVGLADLFTPPRTDTREAHMGERLLEATKTVESKPARLPGVWDWTRYVTKEADGLFTCTPHVDWLTSSDRTMPWPYWAEELAAKWRLLEHAAKLLFEANREVWSDNKAHRPIREPTAPEWPVVRYLLSHAVEPERLHLHFAPPEQREVGVWCGYDDLPVVQLWGVLQGWAHLRKCANCERWLLTTGLRPRRTCDSACRVASHRRSPGAEAGSRKRPRHARRNVTRKAL